MRYLLLTVFALLNVGLYGVLALEGIAISHWEGVVLFVALLGLIARGSQAAWVVTLALTVLSALTLALMGIGVSLASAAVVIVLALQLTVLLAARPARASNAH
jgi:hypothetical protein